MKPLIYYGNIITHGVTPPVTRPFSEVIGSIVTFTGFDLSSITSIESKLDLLFYNRVNEIGEVLSSLVYISNQLDPDDTSNKQYDSRKLYVNTDAEIALQINKSITDFTYFNCKWASSKFFTTSISPMVDIQYDKLVVNGDPSVRLTKYGVSFDGWYTQMSVGFRTINTGNPPTSPVKQNLLGIHTFLSYGTMPSLLIKDNPLTIDDDSNWSPYTFFLTDGTTNPDGTVLVPGTSLANLLVTLSDDNVYIKQDLFILPMYIAMYDNAIVQYAEYPTYGNPYPALRDKHRVMHDYASDNNFLEAQYILQTTDYFRAIIHL